MRMTEEHKAAEMVRNEIYGGSWRRMRDDLTARQAGRSFLFRLATDIDKTLGIIAELEGR